MSTPIDDFLQSYAAADIARLHMPGHKGTLDPFDITEVAGADALYLADGIIAASERRMAAVYGSSATAYSAGGSTLCIQAMLTIAARRGHTVVCGRNLHGAAVNAMALLGLEPLCLAGRVDDPRLPGVVTANEVADALEARPDAAAVYVTAPDYYGRRCDVAALARVCRRFGVPLLVDNAHGAHLRFLPETMFPPVGADAARGAPAGDAGRSHGAEKGGEGRGAAGDASALDETGAPHSEARGMADAHPITLGAALCCDSPHKTLPALTGAAYMHAAPGWTDGLKEAMSLFGSTSPSYPILRSIDRLLPAFESGETAARAARLAADCAEVAAEFAARGLSAVPGDPTRLVLDANAAGLTGTALADALRGARVEPEYADGAFVVLLPSVATPARDFARLADFARGFRPGAPLATPPPPPPLPVRALPLREAVLAPAERVPLADAVGRVVARVEAPCPPGVPRLLPGERVDADNAAYLAALGVTTVAVVTE